MRHATILVAILAFVPLASASAQARPGERVRVTHCPPNTSCADRGYPSVGTLLSVSGDTLVLSTDGGAGQVVVPLISVSRIEVRGREPARGRGAIIGALVGGVVGLVAALTTYDEATEIWSLEETARFAAILLGGLGAGVGFLVGNFVMVDSWVDVPLERLRVSLGPQRDGRFGFGASVRF